MNNNVLCNFLPDINTSLNSDGHMFGFILQQMVCQMNMGGINYCFRHYRAFFLGFYVMVINLLTIFNMRTNFLYWLG